MISKRLAILGSFVVGATVKMKHMPLPGESEEASVFDLGAGGKGSNQAIGAKRLGAHIDFSAFVGDDIFAPIWRDLYEKEGISTEFVIQQSNQQTGIGLVYLDAEGENTIGIYPGANKSFSLDVIPGFTKKIKEASLLSAQLEIPEEEIIKGFTLAKENDCQTILNPSPFRPISNELLRLTDIVVVNALEICRILGVPVVANPSIEEITTLGRKLLDKGISTVVITLGSKGSLLLTSGDEIFVPAFNVNAVDTVGAGDSFTAAFCTALLEGKAWKDCLVWGNAAGALTASYIGVINALPNREAVETFVEQYG